MKEMPLTQGLVAFVDDEDYGWLFRWNWQAKKVWNTYYAIRKIKRNGKTITIYMHRVIMDTPTGKDTDHRNGNGLDNQRVNLRVCTHAENIHNFHSKKSGASQFKGVCWSKARTKWWAQIACNKRHYWLGYFTDETEAAKAYDRKAIELFGEFAKTNFPVDQIR